MQRIYLDNAATTPVHPDVRAAMEPFYEDIFGNPSSIHFFGRQAKRALERAREQVAEALGADPSEIVFTSGGTEADNAALIGSLLAQREKGRHLVTTAIEHHAVLHTCSFLEDLGFRVTYVPPEGNGIVPVQRIQEALRDDTVLVSVMYANNETGALQPVEEIAAVCREKGVEFHTDAVQAFPFFPIDVKKMGFTYLSLSAHKFHGPKGVGALFLSRKAHWLPLLHGGKQERERRGGTENLAAIVGLGAAVERNRRQLERNVRYIGELRERMIHRLREGLADVVIHTPRESVPSILSVAFPGVPSDLLLMNLDLQGVAASAGSACTAGTLQPSHVLTAMGLSDSLVHSTIRFSFSEQNTGDEVEEAARRTISIVQRLRR